MTDARRYRCCLLLLLLSSVPVLAEEWMGLDESTPVLIALDLGRDEIGNDTRGLGLLLPLGETNGLQASYSTTDLDDGEQSFDNRRLVTQVWVELKSMIELDLQYFFEGNTDELELETLGIGLSLRQGDWRFRVHLEQGELLIFTRDEINDFLTRIPERIDGDVDVFGVEVGSSATYWYWQGAWRRYDYERDLTRLDTSNFAQFVVEASALAHSSLLISEALSLLVGRADLDDDYTLYYSRERSALDERYYDSLAFGWEHWATPEFGFQLGANYGLESAEAGFSLGLRWVL